MGVSRYRQAFSLGIGSGRIPSVSDRSDGTDWLLCLTRLDLFAFEFLHVWDGLYSASVLGNQSRASSWSQIARTCSDNTQA